MATHGGTIHEVIKCVADCYGGTFPRRGDGKEEDPKQVLPSNTAITVFKISGYGQEEEERGQRTKIVCSLLNCAKHNEDGAER